MGLGPNLGMEALKCPEQSVHQWYCSGTAELPLPKAALGPGWRAAFLSEVRHVAHLMVDL